MDGLGRTLDICLQCDDKANCSAYNTDKAREISEEAGSRKLPLLIQVFIGYYIERVQCSGIEQGSTWFFRRHDREEIVSHSEPGDQCHNERAGYDRSAYA